MIWMISNSLQALQRFLPNAPSSSILLLVSSDVNLLSDIYQAKVNPLTRPASMSITYNDSHFLHTKL